MDNVRQKLPVPIMYDMEAYYGRWVLAEEQPFPKEDGRYFVYPGKYDCPDLIFFTEDGKSINKGFSDGPTWYQYDAEGYSFDEREEKVTHWLFLDNKNPT